MKDRFLSGEGRVWGQTEYLATVSYMIAVREAGPIDGSLRVLGGADGLSLYEHEGKLVLYLDDGRLLPIIMQTPLDLTDDSWQILGSSSIEQP